MADAATKSLPINGGSIITDLKSLFSVKTGKTMAFAYGFMFAFVVFTVLLAFGPSPNSSSPWYTNIFSTSSTDSSYRSPVSSLFSHFFPNNTSPQNSQNFTSLPEQNTTNRSNTTMSKSLVTNKKSPSLKNNTQSTEDYVKSVNSPGLQPNKTSNVPTENKVPTLVSNRTRSTDNLSKTRALSPNQTTIVPPTKNPVAVNQSMNSPSTSGSLSQGSVGKVEKGVADKGEKVNYTASPVKRQNNGSNSGLVGKQEIDSLMNCNLFDGEWVKDDSYPLYKPGSCSLIDEQFNCILNGRPDKDYQKYKWKPKGCSIPRLNPGHMLHLLRGKRLVFVGDSLNRNMWESLVCILKASVKDQTKIYEAHGRSHFRGEASYSFIFKDYNCTVEFFVSPFLVREWEVSEKDGTKKETLRLDLVGKSSDQYKNADIIVFNTGHWWTHEKTSRGKDYYQEGSHVYNELNVLEAFRKALTTWGRWVDANINPMKSLVFFRGYSASHFSGGQWNSGGACDSEVEPIKNATYLRKYPPKMLVLEKVIRGMKTHVTYLNVTQMTDYRKDGHPSIYRRQNVHEEERTSPLHFQDCSHWCLPGVPDTWNEIFYAELLINENRNQQVQKRHR